MFCVIPSCSASVFDLVAAELDGGWERKKEREWLVLAVKSPSVNELSSADRSSHTFIHTPSSSAADLRFGKIFIHKNLKWTPISVWLLKLSIKIFKTASGMTFSCQFIGSHKHTGALGCLEVLIWTFWPLRSKVSPNQESKCEQKGLWTPLTVHYSSLSLFHEC